jgi:hypothetical protein
VFSWSTCIPGTWEFDALTACGVSSPPRQQSAFFFRVERMKRLWHDCSSSSSLGNRTWTKCESIILNYLPSGKNFGCHTNLLCHKVGRVKKSDKLWCEIRIVCTGKNILPNHGIVWEAIKQPKRSLLWSWTLYMLGMTSWLGRLVFFINKLSLQWFKFHFAKFELERHGLETPPSC